MFPHLTTLSQNNNKKSPPPCTLTHSHTYTNNVQIKYHDKVEKYDNKLSITTRLDDYSCREASLVDTCSLDTC